MHAHWKLSLLLALLITAFSSAQTPAAFTLQAVPTENEVLTRVRGNIAAYAASLPSFSAVEQVTSEELRKDRVIRQMQLTSGFRVKPMQSATGPSHLTESHSLTAVDGKLPKKGKTYSPPFTIANAFSGSNFNFLDIKYATCFDFSLESGETSPDQSSLVLTSSLKPASAAAAPCNYFVPGLTATARLDPVSFQITRLDSRVPSVRGPKDGFTELHCSTKYASVTINGKQYLLPASVLGEIFNRTSSGVRRYNAIYSDYHKYDSTSTIIPVLDDAAQP